MNFNNLFFLCDKKWSSPYINHFLQPDILIPDPSNPQAWNRYGYVGNNPILYNDPTGHCFGPLVVICAALIEAAPLVAEMATYAATAFIAADIMARNIPEVDDKQPHLILDVIFYPASPLLVPQLPTSITLSLPSPPTLKRIVPSDQIGTSQAFKLRKGEDGLSVFEGVSDDDILSEFPGKRTPNTIVILPKDKLPLGTQIIPIKDESLSKKLSDAHRILVRPQDWSMDSFAKTLKKLVGWE